MTDPKPLSECDFVATLFLHTDKKSFIEKIFYPEPPLSSCSFFIYSFEDEEIKVEGRKIYGRSEEFIKQAARADCEAFMKRNGWRFKWIE